MNAELTRTVRLRAKVSLRELGQELGISHCTIHRLEHGKDISAIDYVSIMLWVVMNNPNIG